MTPSKTLSHPSATLFSLLIKHSCLRARCLRGHQQVNLVAIMLRPDGDIIRGLGFVTLYSAYAEEQVDNLLELLTVVELFDDGKRRWPISRKLRHALKLVEGLPCPDLAGLEQTLRAGPRLFQQRNEVVHGRIYASYERSDTLKSGRQSVPERQIEPGELYELANSFMAYFGDLYGGKGRLARELAKHDRSHPRRIE